MSQMALRHAVHINVMTLILCSVPTLILCRVPAAIEAEAVSKACVRQKPFVKGSCVLQRPLARASLPCLSRRIEASDHGL